MTRILHIFTYLIIHAAISSAANAQNLSLILEAEKDIPLEILNRVTSNTLFGNYANLEKESTRLLNEFHKNGFIDCRLISIKKLDNKKTSREETSYKATYFLGPKFSSITIYFNQDKFNRKDISRFVEQPEEGFFVIPLSEVENTLAKLNNFQTEKGDAFAKVYLTTFKKNAGELSAQLISEESITRTIDSIIIKGYEKFPRSYMKYVTGLKKGTIFKRSKIDKATNAIDALPFASNIKSPEVLFKNDKTALYLYIEKQKSNNFDGIIGFSTDDTTNRLVFNGYLDLLLNNNLNYGESIILNYKADGGDQRMFSIKTTLPYILKTPVGINLGLSIFKQEDNFSTTSQLAGLQYQLNPNAIATLDYSGTNSTILSDRETIAPDLVAYKKNEITVGSQWKYYQADALFPIKTTFGFQLGTGTKNTELISEIQYTFKSNASYLHDLNAQNSIYVANQSALLGSESYLTNELFRIGGVNSIRGFKENAIEASLFSIFKTEYRYRFNNLLYIHSIFDIGYIENNISSINGGLYSFGMGTGFYTTTGLLKFSVANGRSEGQEFRFSNLKIHLSLISSF